MSDFVKVTLDTRQDKTQALIARIDAAPRRLRLLVQRNSQPVLNKMLGALKREPGAPDYPIKWKSDRQRKFVMAKLRRENNLPYHRTHVLSQSWVSITSITEDGGVFVVENQAPGSAFVQGDLVQPFHVDRWPQAEPTIAPYTEQLKGVITEAWGDVFDLSVGMPL